MKQDDKKKKLSTSKNIPQKVSSKKSSINKEEYFNTKNSLSPHFSRGDVSGTLTAVHSQNLLNFRNSPKASLGEIRMTGEKKLANQQKLVKVKIGQKTKEQIKKSLANVIKVYYPGKKSFLDVSMTQITNDYTNQQDKVTKNDFHFIEIIGEGGYGKVWKVQHLKTRKYYAMKQMSKALIIMKKSVENVNNQKKILQKINSTFIANIVCAFHDRENLYLTMNFLSGGDLRNHMENTLFNQEEVKFMVACIITGLDHIHSQRIFHRDLKPQNLVLDDFGYLRITDFGIARCEDDRHALDASGTPGYMAPQVICKQNHSYPVDYYAVGIITYQLMFGRRPYFGNNRAQIREAILSKQHSIKKSQIPPKWSLQSADFVNKLIQRQPSSRLGYKDGFMELKLHPWLRKYPWREIQSKLIPSPLLKRPNNFQISEFGQNHNQSIMQYKLLQRAQERLDVFANYELKFKETLLS